MKFSIIACSIFALFAARGTEGSRTLRKRQLNKNKKLAKHKVWKRLPAASGGPYKRAGEAAGTDDRHRKLLNGGGAFIVSQATTKATNSVEWCLDAVNGAITKDGSYPTLGLRPCAFNTGPTEQLFILYMHDGKITSKFDWDTCLIVGNGNEPAKDGAVVRLGPCELAKSHFVFEEVNEVGLIKVESNKSLCVTSSGATPEDYDDIIVKECRPQSDRFNFMMRSGYYELYAGDGYCVSVKENNMECNNNVVLEDCSKIGFGAHWRLDGNGLFHSRLDDTCCMQSAGQEDGAPIVINPCDKTKNTQRFSWPDGFEAPISLLSAPNLYLGMQGQTETLGDNVVLQTSDREWSGDAVHRF